MEDQFMSFAGIVAVVVIALAGFFGWIDRNHVPRQRSVRRGMGNALLGLQEFIDPSVESVLQAQNVKQTEQDNDNGLGGNEDAIRSGLAEALGRTPVDCEEVRRHLSAAARMGMDWIALFDQIVRAEIQERPFRALFIPPRKRVAPSE